MSVAIHPLFAGSGKGEWPMWRRDSRNTGVSELAGPMLEPSISWKYFLGGSVNQSLMKDIDGDGLDEILVVASGRVVAYEANGLLLWSSGIIGASELDGVFDLDANGTADVVTSQISPPTVYILSGLDGSIQWQKRFSEPAQGIGYYGIKVADVDDSGDGKLELICWPAISSYGYAFTFSNGVTSGAQLWSCFATEPGQGYIAPLTVADIDADGQTEVIIMTFQHLYVYNGRTGEAETSFTFPGGSSGRNYGILKLINVDQDPYLEAVVLAVNLDEHLTVIDNTGTGYAVLWRKWYEYSYPEDHKDLRFTVNSVADVDGDGRVEIVGSIYNDTGDEKWHLMIFDGLSGAVELDLLDTYFWGLQDIDADGRGEILASHETSRLPSPDTLYAYEGSNSPKWTLSSAAFLIERLPEVPLDVNGTSGRDELYEDE